MKAWLRAMAVSFARTTREARRSPALAIVFPMVPALAMVAVYAELLARMSDLPGFPAPSYVDWMAAGAVTVVPMTGAAFSGMALATDIRSGYLERIRLLPVNPIAFVTGRVLFDGLRMLPATAVVLVVAAGLGADYHAGVAGMAVVAGLVVLWTAAYIALFLLIAVRSRSPEAVQAAFPIFAPLTFLSTVWFPQQLMPGWAEATAGLNPVTAVTNGIRDVLTDGIADSSALGAALVAAAVALGVAVVLQGLTDRALLAQLKGA